MNNHIQFKRDTTRLKHLLDNYRDHIITNVYEKQIYKGLLTDTIKEIDKSIYLIKEGL